ARDLSTARGSTWGSTSAPWSESWHSPAVSTATSRCRSTPDLFHAFLKNSAETRKTRRGSVTVGVSHDTSAFAARAIAHWWLREGSVRYPRSRQLLIL